MSVTRRNCDRLGEREELWVLGWEVLTVGWLAHFWTTGTRVLSSKVP